MSVLVRLKGDYAAMQGNIFDTGSAPCRPANETRTDCEAHESDSGKAKAGLPDRRR